MNEIDIDTRKLDMSQEREVLFPFLYENIYPIFYEKYTEINDLSSQLMGIDTVFPDGNHDAKAQMKQYINEPTNTFCLEVLFDSLIRNKQSGEVTERKRTLGWFSDDCKQTDYYDFVWIHDADTVGEKYNKKIISKQDIRCIELMIVNVKFLKSYIFSLMSKVELLNLADKMRNNNIREYVLHDGIKLVYSNNVQERPVNLVIRKGIYKQFAIAHIFYDCGTVTDVLRDKPNKLMFRIRKTA